MARIILSDAVQFGIKGTTKSKPRAGKKYQELVRESDKKNSDTTSICLCHADLLRSLFKAVVFFYRRISCQN